VASAVLSITTPVPTAFTGSHCFVKVLEGTAQGNRAMWGVDKRLIARVTGGG
jgi:hypothetical protein